MRDLKVDGAIFHEGEEEDDAYIVTLGKGEIIGKTSLITDVPHSATAIAEKILVACLATRSSAGADRGDGLDHAADYSSDRGPVTRR